VYGGVVFGLAAGVLSGRDFAEPWSAPVAHLFGLTFDDIRHATSAALPRRRPAQGDVPRDWLGYCAVAGALLGFGLYGCRRWPDVWWRFGAGLAVGAAFVTSAASTRTSSPASPARGADARSTSASTILIGCRSSTCLRSARRPRRARSENHGLCAALGVALHLMNIAGKT